MTNSGIMIEAFVRNQIAELTGIEGAEISACNNLVDEGYLDSLSLLELFLILEREYGSKISNATTDVFSSVSSIAHYILRDDSSTSDFVAASK